MKYDQDEKMDRGITTGQMITVVNRLMNRRPRKAADSKAATAIFRFNRDLTAQEDLDFIPAVYIDQTGTHSGTYGQLTPEPDGVITEFYTSRNYKSGTLVVYYQGMGQHQGTTLDYTESATPGKFTFVTAPLNGSLLAAAYQTETTHGRLIEAQIGGTGDTYFSFDVQPNGARTQFTANCGAFISTTARVYINGQMQMEGTAYDMTIDGDNAQINFNAAPPASVLSMSAQPLPGRRIFQTQAAGSNYGTIVGAIPGTVYNVLPYKSGKGVLSLRGQRLTQGSIGNNDWYESDTTTGEFTLNAATVAGDLLLFEFEIED